MWCGCVVKVVLMDVIQMVVIIIPLKLAQPIRKTVSDVDLRFIQPIVFIFDTF